MRFAPYTLDRKKNGWSRIFPKARNLAARNKPAIRYFCREVVVLLCVYNSKCVSSSLSAKLSTMSLHVFSISLSPLPLRNVDCFACCDHLANEVRVRVLRCPATVATVQIRPLLFKCYGMFGGRPLIGQCWDNMRLREDAIPNGWMWCSLRKWSILYDSLKCIMEWSTVNQEIFVSKIFVCKIFVWSNFYRIDHTYVCFRTYGRYFVCSIFVVCDEYEN